MMNKQERAEYYKLKKRYNRVQYFHDKICSKCGSTDRLELHHLDPTTKVADHAIWLWSEKRRVMELAKCAVLCNPCHKAHHAGPPRPHGTMSRYKREGCRCEACREAKRIYRTTGKILK